MPGSPHGASVGLEKLFAAAGREVPAALADWESRLDAWCDEYVERWSAAEILEIDLGTAVYLFDYGCERVLVAYGLSIPPSDRRDTSRMRGFPDVNVGARKKLGRKFLPFDKGHFLAHSVGGELDINLFPQERALNRGWSTQGKLFRKMERHAAENPGVFLFHRAIYGDDTWIPEGLEYGLLVDHSEWWIERFSNVKASG